MDWINKTWINNTWSDITRIYGQERKGFLPWFHRIWIWQTWLRHSSLSGRRSKELGRETTREGGGRKGTLARKPFFSPSRLLIKKITKNNATVKSGRDAPILVVFLALFFFRFPKTRNLKWRYYKQSSNAVVHWRNLLCKWQRDACRVT